MNRKHTELLNQAAHNRKLGERSRAALFLTMAGTERLIVMMEKKYARTNRKGWTLFFSTPSSATIEKTTKKSQAKYSEEEEKLVVMMKHIINAGKIGVWRRYHAKAMQQAVTSPTGALRAINLNLAAECRYEIQRLKQGTNAAMRKEL